MAALVKYIALLVLMFASTHLHANTNDPNEEITLLLEELGSQLEEIQGVYEVKNIILQERLISLTKSLQSENTSTEYKVAILIEKDHIQSALKTNALSESSDISKIRYLKGLQIIKILYEKTLTLDHHFSSVATFNEMNNLSNPNNYPEFIKMKDNITSKQDKKEGFNLTTLLGNNMYTSVVHTVVSLFSNSNSSKTEKEESLKEVECILDFTLRMHNDLNTIFFETSFLQKSNDNVMSELEQLFVDYTKPIQYKTPLQECRNSDDWDAVRERLNRYLDELDKAIKDPSERYRAHKMQINLEFPIDRLLQFITIYNSHIDQGGKFYEKFGIMLNSYENEEQCATKIPLEYKRLKENITVSIKKFNTAYKPVEINGSKMKQILYGINEFD